MRDEVLQRVECRIVSDSNNVGIGADQRYRREVDRRVEGQRREQERLDLRRSRREQQRVAVGRRMSDGIKREPRAGARLVLDNDLLAPKNPTGRSPRCALPNPRRRRAGSRPGV